MRISPHSFVGKCFMQIFFVFRTRSYSASTSPFILLYGNSFDDASGLPDQILFSPGKNPG